MPVLPAIAGVDVAEDCGRPRDPREGQGALPVEQVHPLVGLDPVVEKHGLAIPPPDPSVNGQGEAVEPERIGELRATVDAHAAVEVPPVRRAFRAT